MAFALTIGAKAEKAGEVGEAGEAGTIPHILQLSK